MMQLPLISVVVPVYKVEAYLDHCLKSITGQTYSNLEILLVEDGSPDDSGAICDAWAQKDSRITVIHQKNSGGGAARNAALDIARGELLAFVDSDDYIAPDMYEHLYSLLQTGADIAECGYVEAADNEAVFGQGDPTPVTCTAEEAMLQHIQDTYFRQLIWNKLYRREVAEGIRFPVGTKIDDEYYTYQLLGNAKTLVRSQRVCYAYRQQAGSVMHEGFSLKRVDSLRAKEERLEYLKANMPALVEAGKEDLILTCLFVMQESLRGLKGREQQQARQRIAQAMEKTAPFVPAAQTSRMRKLLLTASRKNLALTARILNFLIDIHVLT